VEIAPAKEKHQVTGKYNFNNDFLLYPPLTIGSATHVLFFIILFLMLFKLATSPISVPQTAVRLRAATSLGPPMRDFFGIGYGLVRVAWFTPSECPLDSLVDSEGWKWGQSRNL
jgi:hypothetical protein